jgi:plastocyanin
VIARVLGVLALAVLALAAAACSDVSALRDENVPGAAVTVHIVDSPEDVGEFDPSPAHVRVGQTVAFLNASGNFHTVTFTSGPEAKSSAGIKPGGRFEVTFHHPGVYHYRCLYHQPMTGEIDVAAAPASPPPASATRHGG